MNKEELKRICEQDPLDKDDYSPATPGVLLSHQIEHFAINHRMIIPFTCDNLKPAGYYLSLGEDYAIGGKLKKLSAEDGKNELKIPPFEVAIISTKEVINLPRFIIARWNLRVTLVYQGLLWTGALQVDPGWCGSLCCPIYNLSSEEVTLKLGDPIVLMDFVKTTPFEKDRSKKYKRPPDHQTLDKYNWPLKSALYTEAAQKIGLLENKINRIESFIGIMFTSIAVLFAALSIIVTSRNVSAYVSSPPTWFIIWVGISIGLSIMAIGLVLISRVKLEYKKKWQKFTMAIIYVVSAIVVLTFLVALEIKIISWADMIKLIKSAVTDWLR